MSENNELSKICSIYNTDKEEHGYTEIYHSYFKDIKDKNLKILEIGVADGNSLNAWSEYFKNSKIVGIDIKDINIIEKKINKKNIDFHKGSQTDENFLNTIIEKYKKFDIIIDDGSHYPKDVIKSYNILFNSLSDKGMYFVEDMQTSYIHFFKGNAFDLKNGNTHMNFFKHMTDSLNYQEIANPFYKKKKYDSLITNISFYHNLVMVRKGENLKESNLVKNNSYENKRYETKVKRSPLKLQYYLKYKILCKLYTYVLFIFFTIKKLILFRF